jgi:phosphocarrier protein HPr
MNARGLHARAAAKFVKCVERFDAEVSVARQGNQVDGFSIMGLMMLAASKGTAIEISASGPDGEAVLTALSELIAARFEEEK